MAFDQMKMLAKLQKAQKELKKEIIEVDAGLRRWHLGKTYRTFSNYFVLATGIKQKNITYSGS